MVLNLVLHHVNRSALNLLRDIIAQFGRGKGFLLTFREHQVHRLHLYQGIDNGTRFDLLAQALQRTYLIALSLPVVTAVADRIVADNRSRHVAHQLLVLELIERETVTRLGHIVVLLQIGNHTRLHHQLHVAGRKVTLLVLVLGLEIHLNLVALRNHIATQIKVNGSNQCRRYHIRAQQALKAYTGCQHGYNLAIARQLTGKEDDGNKHKQR